MKRRLSAVLIADVVGYSRLTQQDEEGTRARFNEILLAIIKPAIEGGNGRLIKNMGDGLLVEFASVVNAVRAAADIQKALAERNRTLPEAEQLSFRFGINLGDIIVEGDDIQGNGVNIAARLQTLAEPGGIVVSRSVYDEVKDKLGFGFESLGPQQVKGIEKPIRAFRANLGVARKPAGAVATKAGFPRAWAMIAAALFVLAAGGAAFWFTPWFTHKAVTQDARPSIIVLPFDNLSDDKEQGYLADGITEDITTELARMPDLFVISRSAAFGYKGQDTDPKVVSQEMGVRYVLEGSVRRAGDEMRINAQLIDGANNGHLWAQRFEGEWQQVLTLQDNVVRDVASALAVTLVKTDMPAGAAANIQTVQNDEGDTDDPAAYDAYWQGRTLEDMATPDAKARAITAYEKAVTLDPNYGDAYAALARIHMAAKSEKAQHYLDEAMKRPSADAYQILAQSFAAQGENDKAIEALKKAAALDPSDPEIHMSLSKMHSQAGQDSEARAAAEQALKLNPKAIVLN